MKGLILAIDTSAARASLALVEPERLLAEYTAESPVSYLERLLPAIEQLLRDTQRHREEIQALIVSAGPGNFTGLRIGIATAKGLALALGCPVAAVPTLDTIAANFPYASLPICAVLDAKKNELYAAFYRCPGDTPERSGDYLRLSPEKLAERVTAPTILTGPGLERYGDFLKARLADFGYWAPPELRHVRASILARLGRRQLAHGPLPSVDQLTPLYLRPVEVELQRTAA